MLKEKVCLEAGCDFKSSNASVFDHEKDCDFRSVRCPILDCYSVVVFNGLERHMEEKHANMADGKWHIFEVRDNRKLGQPAAIPPLLFRLFCSVRPKEIFW